MNKIFKSSVKFLTVLMALAVLAEGTSVSAQMVPTSLPQFMPVGGWSVEKTAFAQTRGLGGVQLPCMMATNYDNGYILRFSGATGRMMAMAVDFRQDVFKQGRKYNATIALNNAAPQKLTATAFSESTLILNVRPLSGLYQQLQGAVSLMLNVEGNAMIFNLNNMPGTLAKLEQCYGPVVPVAPIVGAPMVAGNGVVEPTAPVTQGWGKPMAPNTSAMNSKPLAMAPQQWRAKAGDDIRSTLERWSANAGVTLDWQSSRGGRVTSDIAVQGTFQDAVQQLMAQNSAALGLDAMMGGGNVSPRMPTAPMMPSISSAPQPIAPIASHLPEPQAPSRWGAQAGANLQLVLQKWSEEEGVDFVWQSHHTFVLKRPVNTSNSYESALQAVLSQFSNEKIRPAAQLNNDPQTGKRLLVVQSSRVL